MRLRANLPAALLALGLAACASPQPVPRFGTEAAGASAPPSLADGTSSQGPPAVPEASPAASETTAAAMPTLAPDPGIAVVGGRTIRVSDLLAGILFRQGDLLRLEVNLLIGSALAKLEAERLGLQLDMDEVEQRFTQHLGDFARRNVPEGMELDRFVRERLQIEPTAFRSRLRADTVREMVTERVVRAHTLASEHARLRLLAAEPEAVAQAQERYAAGESFVSLVRELSRDASAEQGGLLPFVGRSERSPISLLAFRTPVGQVGGPVQVGGLEVLALVESRPEPVVGDWRTVEERVLESLEQETVREEEFVFWQVAMERRYDVDLSALGTLLPDISP